MGLSAMMKIRWCIALTLRLLVCSQYKVVAKFIFFSHDFFHKIERTNKRLSGFLFTTALAAYLTVMIISAHLFIPQFKYMKFINLNYFTDVTTIKQT